MQTYLVERKIPADFHYEDPANVALHARWAVDAYRKAGAFWIGGLVTDSGMFSVVVAEQESDIHAYGAILGFPERDMVLRRVIRPIGPFFAQPLG